MGISLDKAMLEVNESMKNPSEELANVTNRDNINGKDEKTEVSDQVYEKSTKFQPDIGGGASVDDKVDVVPDVADMRRKSQTTSKSKKTDKTKKQTKDKSVDVDDTVTIHRLPKEVLDLAKQEFPTAKRNADALAAYMIVKSGSDTPFTSVPDSVKELVDEWEDKEDMLGNVYDRIRNIEKQMTGFVAILQELELALSFLTYDRLGFRRNEARNPRGVDFLEPGVTDVTTRLREQTKQYRTEENRRTGRPIR